MLPVLVFYLLYGDVVINKALSNVNINSLIADSSDNATNVNRNNDAHCRDIDETCQELSIQGYCDNTDFVRHFCPISCRNPNCTHHFPLFTSKSNHWRQISSTVCDYPHVEHSTSSLALYLHPLNNNISLNECQKQCITNPFCRHIIYIHNLMLAQTPINSYFELFYTFSPQRHAYAHTSDINLSINICIHSYIASASCHPICVDSDIIHNLLNTKTDINTQTTTAKLLSPFIFTNQYQYISPFSLYLKQDKHNTNTNTQSYWNTINTLNTNNKLISYKSHEYYYPQMLYDSDTPPMLAMPIQAPHLEPFPGKCNVRLEFESRVPKALDVSWINTRNHKEYFQETLEANTWSITKARNSFNGHIFVIRDSETKQWVTTYKNNPSHTHVFITVTPFGVCVRDQHKHSSVFNETQVNKLLKECNVMRWGSNADIVSVWNMYQRILWMTSNRKTIGKVLNLMGNLFLFGSFDEIFDYNIAWSYFKVASMIGDGDALYNMAFMIEKKLLPSDLYHYVPKRLYNIAMLNYWCAAQSHSHKAQLLLGFRYLNGIGMNKSCHHSVFFYQKLAGIVRNDARSLDKYVDIIDLEDPPPTAQDLNMKDHQIQYYKQYAAMGRAWANNHLGQVYLFGLRGIAQNYEMAAHHFAAAVDANDPIAANYLGRLYWNGLGRQRNLNKTRELFTFAAQHNVSQAQNNLAFMWWKGIGTAPNITLALKWFKRAADQGFAQAMFYLAEIYKTGDTAHGVEKNISRAVQYYISATKRRHYRSMYELGILYKDGRGVHQDCEKAVALFKYVAEYHDVKFELENARTAYEQGNYAQSYVIYAQKAEEGYINGEINAAYLARNGYHSYLYSVDYNPFYEGLTDGYNDGLSDTIIKTKRMRYQSDIDGECENNVFIIDDDDDDGIFGAKYVHKVSIPEHKELAFRYYSFAASQNHSRSLRILGDYYWYQYPPINLFSYLSNVSLDINNGEYGLNLRNINESKEILQIDEYDQRSMALSIAYLSTPHSIVQYSDIDMKYEHKHNDNDNNRSINVNSSDREYSVQKVIKSEYLLRHEVIACYLYELASLQTLPKVDGQSLYDFAYCFEYGRGRESNISKAREIYWTAMNKSSDAWMPVFITLLKMEVMHLYHLSKTNGVSYDVEIENIILFISFVMLILVLCVKSIRNSNTNSTDDMVAVRHHQIMR